jgi:protein phosphatase
VGDAGDGARTRILPATLDEEDDDGDDGGGPRVRTIVAILGVAVVAIALTAGAVIGLRESHFIGADTSTGRVAIYQGVPVDLPLGVHLYHIVYESTVSYAALTPRQRQMLFDHTLRTVSGARSTLHPYEVASP